MDDAKCRALKLALADLPEPCYVSVAQFFDGNDDVGSIGCNLLHHPGLDAFRATFDALAAHRDVQAVSIRIEEVDPGPRSWPFADTVLVVGEVSADALRDMTRHLGPDQVTRVDDPRGLSTIPGGNGGSPATALWWD